METPKKLLIIINTIFENRGKSKLTEINPDMNLRDDLYFDSLDLAELTVRIEAKFGIDIFEKGLVNTVGEVLNKLTESAE